MRGGTRHLEDQRGSHSEEGKPQEEEQAMSEKNRDAEQRGGNCERIEGLPWRQGGRKNGEIGNTEGGDIRNL